MASIRPHLPLNALRAFESSARHLSFTRAAEELFLTQSALPATVVLVAFDGVVFREYEALL